MAVTWNVLGIRKLATEGSLSNVCKFIDWECKDSETVDDKLLRGYVCSDVVLSAADSSSFVAYADITSDMAVTWNVLGIRKLATEGSLSNVCKFIDWDNGASPIIRSSTINVIGTLAFISASRIMFQKIANVLSIISFLMVSSMSVGAYLAIQYMRSPEFERTLKNKIMGDLKEKMVEEIPKQLPKFSGKSIPL